ncbi:MULTISPECIES: DUF805 domain-containing protein [Alphaproteobacteria]|uniref:DUF805 domain-containing protein n=2 Tax=Alphaproteobacteria TaxID=28211 RepID=A0A512HE31_9HYPH|nr:MULTISPECIES: DUF805 domain-containing protein [Alphaproteobacteria]GEO83610.1 DUF805 domain-containing protein [Ciceribacter naphthalenivorans]GLR24238.1 DUF805 domain-containing protein [Ciceribacter naphthalenivorans]GLT07094.1 DUF805 domain-containing protein [Sphingomonas psychrolutea]
MQAPTRRPTVNWLLFSPSGRAGRQVFILGWLFWLAINSYTVASLALHQEDEELFRFFSLLFFAGLAASSASTIMLSIKRLHDMGLPGLLVFVLFIPAVSLVMLFVLCLWPSQSGANSYGPAPDWPQT